MSYTLNDEQVMKLEAEIRRLRADKQDNGAVIVHLQNQIKQLRDDLNLRSQTAHARRAIIADLEAEVARLRADNEKLRTALRKIMGGDWKGVRLDTVCCDMQRIAKTAIEQTRTGHDESYLPLDAKPHPC
jgi:chromosome segregation ATPase